MATRMEQLARPKPDRLRHPDRRSVYWLNKVLPPRLEPTTEIELTPRWSKLCRSKRSHTQEMRGPVWEVSEWALRAVASERLCRLAWPRAPAMGWQPDLPPLAPPSRASQSAIATLRICQLARPKARPEVGGERSKPASASPVPCKTPAHIELLATPKHDHPKFEGARSACWPVSRAARNHVASRRLLELSGPRERKGLFEGYDPYAISWAARSASPSPRIQQLCLPLPRKCSAK